MNNFLEYTNNKTLLLKNNRGGVKIGYAFLERTYFLQQLKTSFHFFITSYGNIFVFRPCFLLPISL